MDNILILGSYVSEYLQKVQSYLQENNATCELAAGKSNDGLEEFHLSYDDYSNSILEYECFCIELEPNKLVNQMKLHKDYIEKANIIISIIPIKYFPAMRYNVDEIWEDDDYWVSPAIYARLLNSLKSDDTEVVWILQGIEKVGIVSDFFFRKENKHVLNMSWELDANMEFNTVNAVVENFLEELGEKSFWNEIENQSVCFWFTPNLSSCREVGEKAMKFWTLYSFVLKTNIGKNNQL